MTSVGTLHLYRALLREASRFASYNYRRYAVQRVQQGFRENKAVHEPKAVAQLLERAKADLEMLRRQSTINRMYTRDHLVLEEEMAAARAKLA